MGRWFTLFGWLWVAFVDWLWLCYCSFVCELLVEVFDGVAFVLECCYA